MGSPLCGYVRWWSVREAVSINRFHASAARRAYHRKWSDCCMTWSPMDSSDTAADPRPRHVLYSPPTSGKNYVDLVTIRVLTFPEAVEVTQATLAAAR